MSTLQQPPAPPRKKPGVEYVEYDKYIDRQVERTRKAVKLIDLAQSLLVLVIGVVGFLLTAAVIEHWIFTGGLGTIGRFALFVVMAGSLGYYAVRYVWPLITSSINPAYAAAAIEREHPALKNSLLNFLLFRSHKKEMPAAVYEALEQQAAQRLSQTSIEDSIDRSALVKLGYVLLAVVVFATLYAMLSPKSSFTTAARVLMPWANIAAPSRVRIDDIKPGDVEIVEGDKVEITAQVTGLSDGELVEVSYDTIDGHRVDQRVAMQPANSAGKFALTLPPPGDLSGLSGIDQDLRYRITAGDGRTIDYNIHVLTAPSIRVEKVHFDFPDYTGYADVTIDGRGDIRALEGTKVTILATANTDIEAAFLDLASDGRNDARMKHEGSKAQVDVDLRLEDRRAIKTTSYMLRYTSTEGLANNEPPQHSLEIVPDYAPEVSVLAPEERAKDVQMNEMVPITVEALDPDFALRTVTLKFAKEDGTAVHDELLVDRAHKGRFQRDWNFTPVELKLQPGDIVEYWAEATDIRTPQANRTASDRKQFRVVGDPQQGQGQRGQGQGQPQEQEGENGEQGQAGENGAQGEQGQAGENGQQGEKGQQGENGAQGEQGEQGENGQEGGEQGQQGGEQGQGNQQGENSQNGEGQGNQQGAGAAGEQQQGGEGMNEGQQQGAGGAAGEQPSESQSQDGAGGEQGQSGASGSREASGDQGEASGEEGSQEGGEQQSGEGNQGGEQNSRPVANDGSDDASAFEKIQRQLSQEEQQNATRQQKEGTADPNGKMEQGNPQDAQQGEQSDQASGRREASGGEKGESGKPSDGNPQGQGEKGSSNEASNNEAGEQGEGQKPDGQEGSPAEREAEGAGADAKTDAPQSEGGKPNESQPDAGSKSAGTEERNAGGEPGAGQDTKAEGTPEAQEDMRQRDKKPDMGEGGEEQGDEPPTPAHGKHQSDSASSQGGDRAGGGDEGGGQKAPRKGTGSAGQNEAADDGAGQSDDQGPGETGTRGGDSQKAEGKTGQSGDEKGNGSESRQGQGEQQGQGQPQNPQASGSREASGDQPEASGEQQQGQKGEQGQQQAQQQGQQQGNETEAEAEQTNKGEPGNQGQSGKNEQQQNQQNQEQSEQSANNSASQGGQPGGNDGTAPGPPQGAFDGKLAEGDKANLDYTRQQTNMVLEKLADQLDRNEVDQKMLDELGWSEEDLRQFVDRWNKLRAAAEKPGAADAKQELDARLRSLGGSLGIKGGTTKRTEDDFRNLSEGYQNKVPLKYRDRLKAYTEGVSRGAEK